MQNYKCFLFFVINNASNITQIAQFIGCLLDGVLAKLTK